MYMHICCAGNLKKKISDIFYLFLSSKAYQIKTSFQWIFQEKGVNDFLSRLSLQQENGSLKKRYNVIDV